MYCSENENSNPYVNFELLSFTMKTEAKGSPKSVGTHLWNTTVI